MRIRNWLAGVLVAGGMLAAPQAALAWSNQGHMVTGAVAYDDLAATDPKLVAKVEAVMAAHPDKARFDRGLAGYRGEARARRLFELMARWADDIREGPYDHPAWHYWYRVIPSKADPIKLPPQLLAITTGQAGEAYRLNYATVRDAYAPAAERAVSLCWLFHIAGDIQQPLHAGHLASGRFPMSDRGGENAFVRPAAGGPGMPLHVYWDNTVGGDGAGDANVEAVRRRLGAAWSRPELKELDG
ncbi:MAG: S1/P1 nuclease, partial [Phenylobacterium sp.]